MRILSQVATLLLMEQVRGVPKVCVRELLARHPSLVPAALRADAKAKAKPSSTRIRSQLASAGSAGSAGSRRSRHSSGGVYESAEEQRAKREHRRQRSVLAEYFEDASRGKRSVSDLVTTLYGRQALSGSGRSAEQLGEAGWGAMQSRDSLYKSQEHVERDSRREAGRTARSVQSAQSARSARSGRSEHSQHRSEKSRSHRSVRSRSQGAHDAEGTGGLVKRSKKVYPRSIK